ncbi:hypothetical protein [Pantoea sp. B65]|uniref:hypothetical protein n=1 Tax=Pantoea sp. B65 TaxID=2813359 RepID=UPI0039B45F14
MPIHRVPYINHNMLSPLMAMGRICNNMTHSLFAEIRKIVNAPAAIDVKLSAEIRTNRQLAQIASIDQTTSAADRYRLVGISVTAINNFRGSDDARNKISSLSAATKNRMTDICHQYPLKRDHLQNIYQQRGMEFVRSGNHGAIIDAQYYANAIGLGIELINRKPL